MSIIPTNKDGFNSFSEFPGMSYNIISYLMDNNELLWRLLVYNDNFAFRLDTDHPNLTKAQKGLLVYDGLREQTSCRVFLDLKQDDSLTQEMTMLRISPIEIIPTDNVLGKVAIGFEIFSHVKINTLGNYQTRVDMIVQQLLQSLNGQLIGGIGNLFFNSKTSSRCKVTTLGSIPYHGKGLVMVVGSV